MRVLRFMMLCAILGASVNIYGQTGPGGVSTDLQLWLKANAGAESSAAVPAGNGELVQFWRDQSPNGYDGQQDASGERPILDLTNTINGNPVFIFDGNNDHFPITALNYPAITTPSALTIYAILSTTNGGEGVILSYDRNEYFRFAADHNNSGGFGLSTTNSGSTIDDFNANGTPEDDGVPHILGGSFDSGVSGTNKYLYFDGTIDNSTDAGNTALGTGTTRFGFLGVGSEANSFNGSQGPTNYLEGSLAEVFYFSDALTLTERQQVESYLAIKYGITLSNDTDGDAIAFEAGEGDYIAADGTTVVWDASANSGYHNDVAGIAEDADAELSQSTSKSISTTSIFTVTDNSLNEDDYVMWGHNGAGLSTSTSSSSFDYQFDRVWKVQITGSTNNIDEVEIDLAAALGTFLPIGSSLGLLIDDNASFSSPTEISGTAIGTTITFTNLDLSSYSGDIYITGAFTPPYPGNVGSNIALWYKADIGVEEANFDTAEDGDAVRYWRDQSGNGYYGQQNDNGERPRYDATNTINNNPVLTFDGGTHLPIRDLNYDITTNTLDDFTIYSIVKSSQATEGIIVSYDRSSFFRFALNHNGTSNFGLSTAVEGSSDAIDDNNSSSSASDGFAHLVGGDYTTATDQKNLYLDGVTTNTYNGAHGATGGILGESGEVPRFGFIAANSEASSFNSSNSATGIVGDIAEIVYYEGLLNTNEKARVESYLAIKYGVTLGSDYVSSTNTTVWDNSANTGYNNDIGAIALDLTSTLNQSQSKSEADGSILTVSDASLSNGDYVIWGSDEGDLSIGTSGTGSKNGRFNRIWRVQITGSTNNVDQMLFDLSGVVIKPNAIGNYALLLDNANDFNSVVREVVPTSLVNGVLQFDNIDLSGITFMSIGITPDLDNDGVADATDIDDDNDGLLDTDEGNGLVDTDGDGIVDSRDLDSDNDGIGDLYESGAEGAGTALATLDADGNGMIDVGNEGTNGFDDLLETAADNGVIAYTVSNADSSGPVDFRDLDSDNNGISDLVESGRSTSIDSDDDGVFEGTDTDEDGIPDEVDAEDNLFGSTLLIPNNQDGIGEPDFRDLDNDEDGINDITEVQLTDADMNGRLDGTTDVDGDGVILERDDDDNVFGQINLADLVTGAGTDWYSYRTGDWNDPDSWTLDPSGSTRVNPGGLIPNNLVDNVTIINGDEITLNFNGLVLSSLTIEGGGIVNIGTTINHNLNVISGSGTISLASDEFPGGNASNFTSSSGGTVIYTDQSPAVDYELTVARTFNNLVINSAANTITQKADLTLNGSLTVQSGVYKINDDTGDSYTDNPTPLSILINGNLSVEASGTLTVGNVDASTQIGTSGVFTFHQLELLGNFTNDGSVSFTNLSNTSIADGRYRDKYPTSADLDNNTGSNDIPSAEFGVVEVLYTNDAADQTSTLNGTTDFYRIEVNKGTSQTFIAEFNASAASNFRLLGRIAMDQSDDSGNTPNIDNHRALGLEAGILKLGDNIVIDQISKEDDNGSDPTTQGGNRNYIIDLDAQLWLASNSIVTKSNDWGIHPFGKLKVSDNATLTFTGTGQRTLLIDNQGVFEMTGGTVNITQYRNKTGADGAPRGSFIMTGGTLNIGQGSADGNHGIFSIPWEEQNFILAAADPASPPTINITLDGNRGKDNAAIQIGVKDGNYNVAESNINIIHTSNRDYKLSSTAPLYNLAYNNSSTGELIISDIIDADDFAPGNPSATLPDDNSGTIPTPATLAQPLVITNDLTITDGRLDANDLNVTIGNLFTIADGGEYDPGANTTTFNGSSPIQSIRLNGSTPLVGGGFNNIEFNAASTTKSFGGDLATVVILGDMTIGSGVTLDDNGKIVQVNGDISNSGTHTTDFASPGRIEIIGGSATHTIGGDGNGIFKILTVDDGVNGITLSADQQIDSVLNLVNGVLDINSNQLTINSTATTPIRDDAGGTANFGTTRYIRTAGNASDGGVKRFFTNLSDPAEALFPFGVNGIYTPATIDLVNVTDDGYVIINPVDDYLATTDLNSGIAIPYYWRVRNDEFTTLPDVSTLNFTAPASVFSGTANLALNKSATQSSTYNGRDASIALDGNTSGNGEANVTHTQSDNEAYWTVDLGNVYDITSINIYNRTDCCGSRLVNYHVFVSDDPFIGTTVASSQAQSGVDEFFESSQAGSPTTISTGAITGRYVRVQLAGTNFLSLAEVEVIGPTPSSLFVPGGVEDGVDSDDTPANDTSFDRFYEINGVASPNIIFDGEFSDGTIQPFQLRTANYTAGEMEKFIGTPRIFYTYTPGDGFGIKWDNGNNWTYGLDTSYDPHDTRQTAAGDYPAAGDVAIIGWVPHGDPGGVDGEPHGIAADGITVQFAELRFSQMLDVLGNPTSRIYARNFQFRPTLVINRNTGGVDGNAILGEGMFWMRSEGSSQSDPSFSGIDIGDFVSQDSSYFVYESANDGFVFNNIPSEVPNLLISGNGWGSIDRNFEISTDVRVNQDLELLGDVNLILSSGVSGDFIVQNDLKIFRSNANGNDSGGFGRIDYPNDASRSIEILGDLELDNEEAVIRVANPDNVTQNAGQLIVHGNIIQDVTSGGGLQLSTLPDEDYISLFLRGTGTHTFTSSSGASANFYDVTVNKGTSQTSSFTFNESFVLNGSANGLIKALTLENGTLILNNGAIDLDLNAGGGDFTIPASAGLNVQAGTVRMTASGSGSGNGMRLDGKLTISGGDVLLDGGATADNYIEYGSAGGSEIEITSGNLVVGSQFRRNTLSDDGVINYTQSGGTALFGANTAPEDGRGVFEIINTGTPGSSSFNLSGATTTFALVHSQASPLTGSFIIDSDVNVNLTTDPYIDFGFNGTIASATYQNDVNETYEINSAVVLPNVRIDNSNFNSPIVDIVVQPLTVTTNLEILNGGTFRSNNFDLTINSGFTNNGTYTPGTNTTIFNGTTQTIGGTTNTTFNNLNINPTTSLVLSNPITVNGDLRLLSGQLDDSGNRISLIGNLYATTDHLSDGSGNGGISMEGSSPQAINLPDGVASIDKLLIDNANGVTLNDNVGAAVVLTFNDELALENGILFLGDNRIVFDADAQATTSASFSADRMISVNGVKKSDGVEKQFLASVNPAAFVIPVGTPDKYTPVTLDVDDSDDPGSILVKPINSIHPSATGPDALNYYWLVTTNPTSVTNFVGSISFQYLESDANNAGQNEATWENNATRLIAPNWFKPSGNLVNITTNVMTFTNTDLSSFGGTTFDGEYTIGNDIPDQLAQYRSNTTGIWNLATNWDIDTDGDGFDDGNGVPQPGTIVIVNTGDVVTMASGTDNDQNIFSLQIDGILDVADSDGHNFGDVSGTGTLRISNSTLPGGNYDNFFTTTAGALDLSGVTSYTISPDFASGIRGLTISGGGTKTLPALAVTIGAGGITINDGATLDNSVNNNTTTVSGDVSINNGVFLLGNSSASLAAQNFTITTGTFTSSGAPLDFSGNVSINGGTLNAGSGTMNIGGDLTLAGAATFNNDNGNVILDGTADQNISGDFSVEDFNNLSINKPSGNVVLAASTVVNVSNTLLLDGGNVNTSASGAALRLLNGVGSISRTSGFIDGPIQVDLTDGDAFSFPVGKSSTYKPVQISIQNTSQTVNPLTWEVEYYAGNADDFVSGENDITSMSSIETNADLDEQVVDLNTSDYWRIDTGSESATLDAVTIDISNVGLSTDDINDQLLQVMVWDEAGGEWDHLGGVSSGTPGDANVVSTSTLSFSEKIITSGAESSTALPVDLIHFSGVAEENKVKLTWATASEINNDFFEVLRSRDGSSFESIGTVAGNGNSNQVISYEFTDKNPYLGLSYYRLRQVDFDGTEELHEIIQVTNSFERRGIDAYPYPNPTTSDNLNVRIVTGDDHTKISLKIVDMSGRSYVDLQFDGSLFVDEHITPTTRMIPGIYFMTVKQGHQIKKQKIVIR